MGPYYMDKREIFQNIIFCFPRMKETCTGLERHEGEQTTFHFWVNYPFKIFLNLNTFQVRMVLDKSKWRNKSDHSE